LTEQIPRVVFVQTTRRKQPSEFAGMKFQFVTVLAKRFFGINRAQIVGKTIQVTDREKTLIDCAARPDLSGGILQLAQVLRNSKEQIHWERLDQYLERWGGGAVVKRLGYLAEVLEIPLSAERLATWQRQVSHGISLLEPGAGDLGPVVSRWQLRINIPILD
jgi:predicted transcriptional regulator of viral defense system